MTLRAALIGLAFVAGFAFLIPYLSDIKSGPDIGLSPVPAAAMYALFIVLGPINGFLIWRRRRRGLTRSEVLTVYAMVAATAAISTVGYATFVTVMVTASQYFASPENRWTVLVQPHIPTWLQLTSPEAIRWFWEGIPEKQPIPWAEWQRPLLAWGAIALCIYAGSFSLMSLVRRDWIEGQRLAFPLAQIPLETVGYRGTPGTSLLRQRMFWIGFAIAFGYGMLGLLNRYLPAVPYAAMSWPIGRAFDEREIPLGMLNRIEFNLSWSSIGIMCLLPVEVSLSLWLFHVLYYAQLIALAALGFLGSGVGYSSGFFGYQTGGALVGFGVFVLYQSRRAIVNAIASWWDASRRERDPLELLKPRYALVGLLASTLGVCLIAGAAGAQSSRLLILLFLFYTTALSLTRVIAAAGTNHVECGPQIRYLLDSGFGNVGVRPATFALLNPMDAIFMTEFKVSFMHYAANDMKIFHASRLRGTSVVLVLAAAVLLMVVLGPIGRIWSGYASGPIRLDSWVYDGVPRWEFGDMVEMLRNPQPADRIGVLAMGSGAAIACVLAVLQMSVGWWRLSPVGFLLQGGWGINALIWANALVGWAIVNIAYRLGGLRLYHHLRPSFFGLFLGGSASGLISSMILLMSGGGRTAG